MPLFLIIALICLLLHLAPDIVKMLRVGKWFVGKSRAENSELHEQLIAAKANLEAVKKGPSSGEYSLLIKTMRAEQKIKDIEEKLYGDRNMNLLKGASIELIGGYVLKAILSIILLVISISYRYTPVLVYDDRFSFTPLNALLSFPTGVANSISVPVCVLTCNLCLGKTIGFIRRKNLLKNRS